LRALIAGLIVVALGIGLSFLIEFAQLFFPPRTVSINDLIFETAGLVFGVLVWVAVGHAITQWMRRFAALATIGELAAWLLPAYLAIVVIVKLMPFDFAVHPDSLAMKYDEGKIRWFHAEGGIWNFVLSSFGNIAVYAPLGVCGALARRPARREQGLQLHPWVVFAAPLIVECLQLFVYSRSFVVSDAFLGTIGVLAGWGSSNSILQFLHRIDQHQPRPAPSLEKLAPVLFIAWFAFVAYLFWRPFDFSFDPAQFTGDDENLTQVGFRHFALSPFADYYWGSKFHALDLFAKKALSFVPLGILSALAMRTPMRRGAVINVVVFAVSVALVLEAGRYFLPGRSPSLGDVVIAALGALIGFIFTQKVQLLLWAESNLWTISPMGRVNP
jgi:VanZ family protein